MPHLGYEFLRVASRKVKNKEYLVAQFVKHESKKLFSNVDDARKRPALDIVDLEKMVLNFLTTKEFNVSQSDINQLMAGLTNLKQCLEDNPLLGIDWNRVSSSKKHRLERIQKHNEYCKDILSDDIKMRYAIPMDYNFGDIEARL